MRPLKFALAAAAAIVEAAIAIALVFTSNHDDNPWLVALLAVAALFSFVTAGLVALWRRPGHPIGYLLAATGYLWFLGALGESNDSVVWTIGYVGGGISIVVFGALILAFPDGILSRRDRWIVAVGGVAGVGANLAGALVDETPARSCPKCPSSAVALVNEPRLANAIATLSTVVVVGVLIAVVASLRERWKRASPARRRVLWPVFSSCGVALALLLTTVVVDRLSSRSYSITWVLFLISFAAVPLTFLAGVLRSRFDRGAAARLLLSIEHGTDVVDAIGTALGDRSIEIAYPLANGDAWIDGDGTNVPAPRATEARSVTLVEPGGEVVAAITHDPALDSEPELIDAVVAAAGFPLLNQRLQAELRGQYTFLETVADTAPSLLITVDLEGRIVNQNRATVRASGYDDEEQLRGRQFWDILIDPSERADVIARFEAAAPDHPPAEYENTFTNVRGETLVVLWRSAPLHGADGRITGIVAGGLDITETHLQAAAREQERVFRNAILNNAPSLLCLIDEHGVLEPSATNVAFEETLEYRPDETGGAVFWERYIVPEEAEEVERWIRTVVAGDRMTSIDTTWLTKSGRRLSVAWSCTRLPSIDGRRLLLVSGVDVTERRRREVELARERDATTTVLEATPSTIAVLGRDGAIRDRDVGNPRAAVNRAFREALGWRDEQLVGRSFLELVADDDAQAAAAIAEAASGSSSAAIETDLLRADGTRVPFSWRASPVVDVTGRTDGLVLVSGADISERRAREREAELRVAFINAMTAAIPSYLIVTHADATIRPGRRQRRLRGDLRVDRRGDRGRELRRPGRSLHGLGGPQADRDGGERHPPGRDRITLGFEGRRQPDRCLDGAAGHGHARGAARPRRRRRRDRPQDPGGRDPRLARATRAGLG